MRPAAPPLPRSGTALGLTILAIRGGFGLQRCAECGTHCYPPAEVCRTCLGDDLPWCDVDPAGTLMAATLTHVSLEPYFRERAPFAVGLVRLPVGVNVVAHLVGPCSPGAPVLLSIRLDAAGRGVIVAQAPGLQVGDRLDFSRMHDGACELTTPDPGAAAEAITEALAYGSFEDIQVRQGASDTMLTARQGADAPLLTVRLVRSGRDGDTERAGPLLASPSLLHQHPPAPE